MSHASLFCISAAANMLQKPLIHEQRCVQHCLTDAGFVAISPLAPGSCGISCSAPAGWQKRRSDAKDASRDETRKQLLWEGLCKLVGGEQHLQAMGLQHDEFVDEICR